MAHKPNVSAKYSCYFLFLSLNKEIRAVKTLQLNISNLACGSQWPGLKAWIFKANNPHSLSSCGPLISNSPWHLCLLLGYRFISSVHERVSKQRCLVCLLWWGSVLCRFKWIWFRHSCRLSSLDPTVHLIMNLHSLQSNFTHAFLLKILFSKNCGTQHIFHSHS